jgi:hypothetical protein
MKKKRSTRKVRKKKSEYMSDEAFAKLKNAFERALAFERSDRRDLKVTRMPRNVVKDQSIILPFRTKSQSFGELMALSFAL